MKRRIVSALLALVMAAAVLPFGAFAAGNTLDYNGHRYERIDSSMTWSEAKAYCENKGGHLVCITSAQEQAAVEQLIASGSKNTYWIGGYRTGNNTFAWVTGEKMTYTKWDAGEPNNDLNKGEDSVHIFRLDDPGKGGNQKNTWNDMPNKGEIGFFALSKCGLVCEYDFIGSNWAQTELEKAEDYGLIPDCLVGVDYTKSITRAEFAAVAVKTYEALSGTKAIPAVNNPFVDTKDVEVLKAYNIGAVNGTSATTFEPNARLNREQAATMLTRVFKKVSLAGWTLDTDSQFALPYEKPALFADDGVISGWAKDSVYFMAANNIIKGVGDNKFAPKNITSEDEAVGYANATREAALAIAVRMVENLD